MAETYNDLKQFDNEAAPQGGGMRPGIDTLADGSYNCTIDSAELTRTPNTHELILRMMIRVESTGQLVERTTFFRTQQNLNFLLGELVTLGFDADKWTAKGGRPPSKELPEAVKKLAGRRFQGTKVTNENPKDPSKPFHNLYINKRLGDTSPAPAKTEAQQTELVNNDPIPY